MIVVCAPRIVVPVMRVSSLNIARASPLGNDSGVVRTLYRDALAPIDPVVNIHPALGIMHIAHSAVGALLQRAAILQLGLLAAFGRRLARDAGVGHVSAAWPDCLPAIVGCVHPPGHWPSDPSAACWPLGRCDLQGCLWSDPDVLRPRSMGRG